jgi:hypothetical protein
VSRRGGMVGERLRGRGDGRGRPRRRFPHCVARSGGGPGVTGGHICARSLAQADRGNDEQRGGRDDEHGPPDLHPPRVRPSRQAGAAELPLPGDRRHEADGRADPLASGAPRCLNRVVQCRGVLAPEGIGRRGCPLLRLEPCGAGSRGRSDRYELLGRTKPIPGKPYDVLLVSGRPAAVFGWTIARSHGFADLSRVRVPFRLRGEVEYNSELAPICLN